MADSDTITVYPLGHLVGTETADAWCTDPQAALVFERCDGEADTNITQRVVLHSPTGLEWGYAGSGPADTALNALLYYTDRATAEALYQRFKFAAIALVPRDGGVIVGADVVAWLEARGARVK